EQEFNAHPSERNWAHMLDVLTPLYFSAPFQRQGRRLFLNNQSDYRLYLDVFFPYSAGKTSGKAAERLKAFSKPKILAVGDQDGLVPVKALQEEAKRLSCQFEVVPAAGHFVMLEHPDHTLALFEKYFLPH